jgi:hypothetical protein
MARQLSIALRVPGPALPAAAAAFAQCELCLRQVDRFTWHHLVPRAKGGSHGPKASLCPPCHRQVHALFSETTLARELHSIPLLQANPQVRHYLRWARKQKTASGIRVRRANHRR